MSFVNRARVKVEDNCPAKGLMQLWLRTVKYNHNSQCFSGVSIRQCFAADGLCV